jgi:opacity protein-like surface antigen
MRRLILLAAAGLLGMTTPGYAQRLEFSLGGGVTQPTSNFGDVAKLGWHGLATFSVFPSHATYAFQGTGFYGQNKFDGTGGKKFKLYGGLLEFRLDMRSGAAFRPYVMAGGGVTHVTGGAISSALSLVDDTKATLAGGIGVAYEGASKVGFFVQVRYVNVFLNGPDLQFIPLSAGLRIAME